MYINKNWFPKSVIPGAVYSQELNKLENPEGFSNITGKGMNAHISNSSGQRLLHLTWPM